MISTILLQKVNIRAEAHFCENLNSWIAFLNSFVNKDTLGIKHFILQAMVIILSWIMSQNDSLVCLLNLSFSKDFKQQW